MAQKRSFRRAPVWKRNDGPFFSLFRVGDRLVIDFEYTPARVAAVKAVGGARYHADDKSWSIPFGEQQKVVTHKEFPAFKGLVGVGDPEVVPLSNSHAEEALRGSPFKVSEEALAGARVELIVRLNHQKRRLRVIPRFGSTAFKIAKKIKGATYCGAEQAFFVPVEELAELLKRLRDKGSPFGVSADAGDALAASAKLRNAILESPEKRSADEFAEAFLTPFVTEVAGEIGSYRPCFFTAEQFKLAFPKTNRRTVQGPLILDERGLLALNARRDSLPFTVWFTEGVHRDLERLRERMLGEISNVEGPIDDTAADLVELPMMWRTAQSGRGALALSLPPGSETRELVAGRIGELLTTKYDSESRALIIEIPDSRLMTVLTEVTHLCEQHGLPEIPMSRSFSSLVADVRERVKLRERCSYYLSLDDVPLDQISGLSKSEAERLFPHQRVAIQWLRDFPHAFLGDDMGLGKTLSVLSYFTSLERSDKFDRLLVVCPNSLTRNWLREATNWFPHLKAMVISGDKAEKAWALRLLNEGTSDTKIVVVNYEGVRLEYVTPELEKLAAKGRTLLCIDESQRVKNSASKTFKALSGIAPRCARRVLLSGTPTPKDVSDLWAQIKLLDGGERFGKSFYKWLGTVAELGNEFSEYAVKRFNEGEVEEAIYRAQEIMLRRRKERVVNLPPKTFSLREIEMTGAQRERYDEIREGLILRMRSVSGEQFVRDITNILEEYLRAVQVASNPRLIDPEWKGDPAKFLELDEIVQEVVRDGGGKIVVWTNYLGNVRELVERYADLGSAAFSGEVSAAEREKTVRAFQNEASPRVLVAVPAAGGVGITLTAAQTAVYIDKTWNAEHWMQSVDRIHRIGQTGTVNVISLLGCKVDEMIHWNLRRKEQGQAEVLGDHGPRDPALRGGPTREELLQALEA